MQYDAERTGASTKADRGVGKDLQPIDGTSQSGLPSCRKRVGALVLELVDAGHSDPCSSADAVSVTAQQAKSALDKGVHVQPSWSPGRSR